MSTLIAIAVVEREGWFLIGPREGDVPLGGLWEFPGGKAQPGETPAEAALRECLEETGLAVEVVGEHLTHTHTYPHGAVELHFLRCRPLDPAAPPRAPYRWVARHELAAYEFPAGNRDILKMLLRPRHAQEA